MSELLGKHEAAEFLGVSVRTLEAWRYRGIGPKSWVAVGNKTVYPLDALTEFAEQKRSEIGGT